MKLYAHVQDGTVREIIAIDDALVPGKDIFTPDFAAHLVMCDASVGQGWTYDGKAFSPPVAAPPPPQTLFTPREFIALFTPAEQTALFKARQTSVEVDMFITLAMAGNVDVTNAEVVADIGAIEAAGLVTASRAKQILAGTAASTD